RPVAREHPPRPVPPVRRRRQPHDHKPRLRVTEWRYRLAPVLPIAKPCRLAPRHPLSPLHQPLAFARFDHLAGNRLQGITRHSALGTGTRATSATRSGYSLRRRGAARGAQPCSPGCLTREWTPKEAPLLVHRVVGKFPDVVD